MQNLRNLINQALQLHEEGKIQDAISLYSKLLQSQKNDPQLLFMLGTAYVQIGKIELGVEHLEKSIFIKPDNAFTHSNLGNALKNLKRYDDALASYDQAIKINPNYADIHNNRGSVLKNLKRYNEAIESYDKAIKIKSDHDYAHNNKGNALKDLKRYDEALESYDKAIQINSNYADAYNNKGNALKELNRYEEALVSYDKAIQIKTNHVDAYNNRGIVLQNLNRYEEALASYDQAININSNYTFAHSNRGNVLKYLNRYEEALVSYDKAIKINPYFVDTYNNKGNALKDLKRFDEALANYKNVHKLKSDFDYILGKILHTSMTLCNWSDFESLTEKISNALNKKIRVIDPFFFLGLIDNPAFSKLTSEIFVEDKIPKRLENKTLPKYYNHKKPKIGYFSADFYDHAVLHLMMDVFKNHNKSLFDFYGFSFGPDKNDKWRNEVKNYFTKFEDVSKISDKEVADLSRKLEIDIAIDLTAYTSNSRSGIFSYRAAPIQVNYLGYPGTMGSDYMDYIIADEVIIPKENFDYYSEKVLYLPSCYQANMSQKDISTKNFKRSDFGLPDNAFVYCSFNNNYKITPHIFDIWMNILKKVPNSVLWIFKSNEIASKNLKKETEERGVDPKRIIFASYLPNEEHLKRIPLADLFLDTFPYNAHVTASDAIRMGVPILTLTGNSFASRVGASILTCIGIKELITSNKIEYQEIGIELAIKPDKLNKLKNRIKNTVSKSPLFDSQKFTKNLENIYLNLLNK